jgi:hypothetical protein
MREEKKRETKRKRDRQKKKKKKKKVKTVKKSKKYPHIQNASKNPSQHKDKGEQNQKLEKKKNQTNTTVFIQHSQDSFLGCSRERAAPLPASPGTTDSSAELCDGSLCASSCTRLDTSRILLIKNFIA